MWDWLTSPIPAAWIPTWALIIGALVLISGAALLMSRVKAPYKGRPAARDFGTIDADDEKARDRRFINSL